MADTLPNIDIPAGQWVNLYDETSIAVGVEIIIENLSDNLEEGAVVRLYAGATAPAGSGEGAGYSQLFPGASKRNQSGDAGAWAWSSTNTLVNIRRA